MPKFDIRRLVFVVGLMTLIPAVAAAGTYTTNFPLNENPISQGGHWVNGGVVGLDWNNVATAGGLAFGTEPNGAPNYADSTAILTGTWGPNQTVTATVFSVNESLCTGSCFEEVELRLRSNISANDITGYEVSFRVQNDGTQYAQVVRWNGALGDFTLIDARSGPGLNNGDTVEATISGSTIGVYINSNLIFTASDSTYTTGNPGMGFYLQGGSASLQSDYGFTMYSATDGQNAHAPEPGTLLMFGTFLVGAAGTLRSKLR